jgi:hypothetical protein
MKGLLILFLAFSQMPAISQHNPAPNLYADREPSKPGVLHCPFHFGLDPMGRLLLINFEKDPDAVYMGFEPQVFDDRIHGKGLLVIGWRLDGRVDVYHQPGLRLEAATYDIAGKGLARMAEVPMERALFEIHAAGVQADIQFNDLAGRRVELKIRESNRKKRQPFGLLAPMGDAAESPSAMPLVLLHDFYFVRKKDTEVSVSIDGRRHQLDQLPIPLDWSWMYFTRYSPDPFIVTFNPAYAGVLEPLYWQGENKVIAGEKILDIVDTDGVPEIRKLTQKGQRHSISLSFAPAFPNLQALKEGGSQTGTFILAGHPSTGQVEGQYEVKKNDGMTHIVLVPAGGWVPNEQKLSLRFLYTVAKIFKHWPTTYRWTARVSAGENQQLLMQSFWERIRK